MPNDFTEAALISQFPAIFGAEPPNHLYHYTDTAATLAILESKSLWASHCRAVNDEKEIRHGLDMVMHALENMIHQRGETDLVRKQNVSKHLEILRNKNLGHCVCSFSEESDLLSQWRAYGADGRGVSIGFNSKLLKQDAARHQYVLGKCIYDWHQQHNICLAFLKSKLGAIDTETLENDFPEWAVNEIEEFIYRVGFFMKHSAFSDEKEWRLVSNENHMHSPKWHYRATFNGFAPYMVIELPKLFTHHSKIEDESCKPQLRFTTGPKVKKGLTSQVISALSHKTIGRSYGTTLSGAPYTD